MFTFRIRWSVGDQVVLGPHQIVNDVVPVDVVVGFPVSERGLDHRPVKIHGVLWEVLEPHGPVQRGRYHLYRSPDQRLQRRLGYFLAVLTELGAVVVHGVHFNAERAGADHVRRVFAHDVPHVKPVNGIEGCILLVIITDEFVCVHHDFL